MERLCDQLAANGIPYMLIAYDKIALLSSHNSSKTQVKQWFIKIRNIKPPKKGKTKNGKISYQLVYLCDFGKESFDGDIKKLISTYKRKPVTPIRDSDDDYE